MKKYTIMFVFLLAVSLTSFVSAVPTTGECVQSGKSIIITILSPTESSLGDALSDGFFGNEPNLLNTNTNLDLGPEEVFPGSSAGFVVGSSSPGPETIFEGFTTWGSVRSELTSTCI